MFVILDSKPSSLHVIPWMPHLSKAIRHSMGQHLNNELYTGPFLSFQALSNATSSITLACIERIVTATEVNQDLIC